MGTPTIAAITTTTDRPITTVDAAKRAMDAAKRAMDGTRVIDGGQAAVTATGQETVAGNTTVTDQETVAVILIVTVTVL